MFWLSPINLLKKTTDMKTRGQDINRYVHDVVFFFSESSVPHTDGVSNIVDALHIQLRYIRIQKCFSKRFLDEFE